MIRTALNELEKWKNSGNRKPLVVRGARQVGKTWIMKEFGKSHYEQVVYINFEQSEVLKNTFVVDFNIERLISIFQIESSIQINPENTLIILDEIQEAPRGITALKYFYENAPEYHVIAAGSLLGVSIHANTSFPVGKVDFLDLYPMSFEEFMINSDQASLYEITQKGDVELMRTFHEKLVQYLRIYYFLGGMPEVISSYIQDKDLNKARDIQRRILIGYEQDFSKYAPVEIVQRIRLVWNAILKQLSKENKKFIYNTVRKGARAKDFELAISWLLNAGLVYKVNRVSVPGYPLIAYADMDVFKLFILDVGLLGAMGNLSSKALLEKSKILTEFKGALTEQFVYQQFVAEKQFTTYYWSAENSTAEIDFLIQDEDLVIPVEVKAEENLQAKSLKTYVEKFSPEQAVRISMSPYREESWLVNVPLYALGLIKTYSRGNQVNDARSNIVSNQVEIDPYVSNDNQVSDETGNQVKEPSSDLFKSKVKNETSAGLLNETGLTDDQLKILDFVRVESRKRKELLEDCLGLSSQTKNFNKHIKPLIDLGLIDFVIKDKPNSQFQRYEITEKGKIFKNQNHFRQR